MNDYLNRCEYLDFNVQNSKEMNNNCIQDPMLGVDQYCMSDYKLYDNIAINSENISIKRDVDSGYGIQSYNIQSNTPDTKKNNSSINSFNNIEGFTGKIFITDNGPGKSYVNPEECPQGFKWCDKTNACVQVCSGCKYKDRMKSQEFNEYDTCFPDGVYDGVTNSGETKCTCGDNNQYCSDKFINNVFSAIGLL